MISRRLVTGLGLAAATFTLSACGQKPAAPATDTVTFSILSTESAQNMESYWTPILADMEKSVGIPVKPFYGSNYTALIEAMRFKQFLAALATFGQRQPA